MSNSSLYFVFILSIRVYLFLKQKINGQKVMFAGN